MSRYPFDYGESYRPTSRRGRRGTLGSSRGMGGFGYGREFRGGERGFHRGEFGYGTEYTSRGPMYGRYGEEFGTMGYGGEYKSRWQTDYGDPFHDRERGTPIRMIRGEFGQYGEEFTTWGRGGRSGYGSEYRGGGLSSGFGRNLRGAYGREFRTRRRY